MVGTLKEHANKFWHLLYGFGISEPPRPTKSRGTCIRCRTDRARLNRTEVGCTLLATFLLTPSPRISKLALMFSELKNWFRRAPPGPLKYMRLGPEGRDGNPLMVEFFFSPCLTWIANSIANVVSILYLGLFTSDSKLVDTFRSGNSSFSWIGCHSSLASSCT